MARAAALKVVGEVTNGGEEPISHSNPYSIRVAVQGSADLLFHAWNPEAVDEKAKAAKNSEAKKTDNIESYVYRNEHRELCIPGEYMRGCIVNAAKYRQDPRSPRKSAMDLFKAGIVVTTHLASLGTVDWDYLDRRRVTVQRNGVNRTRPAMSAGWKVSFDIMVMLPEYITPDTLRAVIEQGGRLVGLGDFRPTYGRYGVIGYEVLTDTP